MDRRPRDIDATPVAWREAGDGPVVLFLHGLGGTRTTWEPQLSDLSDRWRCVAWDMPGYGASASLTGQLTFPGLAEAAVRLLDVLGADRATVVGLSMGGMVGLHTALDFPDRVSSLVLIDSSPAFGFDGSTDSNDWVAERIEPLEAGVTPAEIAPVVLRSVAGPQAPQSVIDEAAAAMSRIPADGLRAAIRCLTTHDVVDRIDGVAAPTLVAVGDQDTETPPAYSRYLADNIPGARYVELPDAGHLSNLEAPEELNRLLRGFLPLATVPANQRGGPER